MKDPSSLHSHCTKRAPHSFDDQGPLQAADSSPAFEAAPQTVWILHFVSPPSWQKCLPVRDLRLSTARHPHHQPFHSRLLWVAGGGAQC